VARKRSPRGHRRSAPAKPARAPEPVTWHALHRADVLTLLVSNRDGLSANEAARRLIAEGPNELREARPIRPVEIFFRQFTSLIVWILIVAGLVSGALGEWVDCLAILAIVVLNAAMGFHQEFSAERSIAALKKMTAPHAKVRREGRVASVPATEIVRGDIIELDAGDLVPADARLLEAASIKCSEAALTGESAPVTKRVTRLEAGTVPLGDRENMVFMGTSVATGTGRAVVVATGMDTEIGHIAHLIEEAGEERTPLQVKLQNFGRVLVWASLGIVGLLFALGWWRGVKFFELFMTSVSLAVAAVPEGLPAVVTIALALGVKRMSRRRALVRRLPSVETLGSTNVICTDKTGTLTLGEMTVRALHVAGQDFTVTGEGYSPRGEVALDGKQPEARHLKPLQELATAMVACNNAHLVEESGQWTVLGDPTEGALLAAAAKLGVRQQDIEAAWPRLLENPFDSDRKRHSILRRLPDGHVRAWVNGAPDVLLARCTRLRSADGIHSLSEQDRREILKVNSTLARRGLRVLAAAELDLPAEPPSGTDPERLERDLVFLGLIGMHDPPRPEARQAVVRCREAGIRTVMITGDHPHTAVAVAEELDIAGQGDLVLSGVDMDATPDEKLKELAPRIAIYARVAAAHKLRIVRAWQAHGAVVAMTGDGVNDAPALKGADIGIAMGKTGTEVTKQASDMIITDDNFASIVAAVEQGRGIYDNIRKTLLYLLAGNTGELVLMAACVLAGLPVPLLPIHLLWINLVTDGLPALCLATDPIDPEVMKRRPRRKTERITDGAFLPRMLLAGLLDAGVALGVYLFALQHEAVELARTHAFTSLVFTELLRSFGARSEQPIWKFTWLSNIHLVLVVLFSFALQILILQSALLQKVLKTTNVSWSECGYLLALGLIPLGVLELLKAARKTEV
jgi:Ca2+-transporting ATPase